MKKLCRSFPWEIFINAVFQRILRHSFNFGIVGVPTLEVVYGGGNIHCITQHQPKA